jgi:DNA anti-recombination protein RmuC
VADEAVNKLGVMLEELGARFELVIEAVSGFGGRLDSLREEMFAQFAEVGGQMRFLSEQIAENRKGLVATHDDLGAEIIRLGEALGKARVEFRDELGMAQAGLRGEIADSAKGIRDELRGEIAKSAKGIRDELRGEITQSAKSIRDELGAVQAGLRGEIAESAKSIRDDLGAVQTGLRGEIAESTKSLKREIAASAEMAARKLGAELKQTNKALANLARKFDRFDDRITVQTRDQDQRLRKVERKRGA